ncbi:hypothetical protein KUCAC02_030461, partial [Chaenocephalus aceratus]
TYFPRFPRLSARSPLPLSTRLPGRRDPAGGGEIRSRGTQQRTRVKHDRAPLTGASYIAIMWVRDEVFISGFHQVQVSPAMVVRSRRRDAESRQTEGTVAQKSCSEDEYQLAVSTAVGSPG